MEEAGEYMGGVEGHFTGFKMLRLNCILQCVSVTSIEPLLVLYMQVKASFYYNSFLLGLLVKVFLIEINKLFLN